MGSKFTMYWNQQTDLLEIETRDPQAEGSFVFEVPINKVYRFDPVVQEDDESFKDIKEKKPDKVEVFSKK